MTRATIPLIVLALIVGATAPAGAQAYPACPYGYYFASDGRCYPGQPPPQPYPYPSSFPYPGPVYGYPYPPPVYDYAPPVYPPPVVYGGGVGFDFVFGDHDHHHH